MANPTSARLLMDWGMLVTTKRSFSAVLVAAVMCLGAAPAAGAADGPPHDRLTHGTVRAAAAASPTLSTTSTEVCGPITEDTVMTEERLACWNGQIADGITVDLNGLTIGGLLIEGSDVVLRNGIVDAQGGFGAIYVVGSDVLLEKLTIQNATGFVVEAGDRTTVRDSRFEDNTGVSVDQYFGSELVVEDSTFVNNEIAVSIQAGTDAVIENNRFVDNVTGVNVWDEDLGGARDTTVRTNRFDGNDVGVRIRGVLDASGTVIERNIIRDSATSGILVTSASGPQDVWENFTSPGGAAGTVIRDNVIQRSGDRPETITVCQYPGQETCATASADDGITIIAADPVVLPTIVVAGNKSTHSAGYGIEADGVTDGERNVAIRNGAGSCIGVGCRGR